MAIFFYYYILSFSFLTFQDRVPVFQTHQVLALAKHKSLQMLDF